MAAALPAGGQDAAKLTEKAKQLRRQSDDVRKIAGSRAVLTTTD